MIKKIYLKKQRNKKIIWGFLVLNILLFSSISFSSCTSNDNGIYITKIVDGDTFEDGENIRYRLLGVDTPESFDSSNNFRPTTGIQKFYATKASNLSYETIYKKKVIIKKWKVDTYKRVVARISIGYVELSKLLLESGLARIKYISPVEGDFFYYPDISYYNQLILAQKYAKTNRIGIWNLSEYEQKIVFPK